MDRQARPSTLAFFPAPPPNPRSLHTSHSPPSSLTMQSCCTLRGTYAGTLRSCCMLRYAFASSLPLTPPQLPTHTDAYPSGRHHRNRNDEGTMRAPPPPPSPPSFRRPGPGRRAGGAAACPAPVRARRLQEAGPDRVATMRAPPPLPSPGRRAGGAAACPAPVRAHRLREAGPDRGPPPPPSSPPPFRRPWPGRQAGRAASPAPIRARRLARLLDWTLFCMSCSGTG